MDLGRFASGKISRTVQLPNVSCPVAYRVSSERIQTVRLSTDRPSRRPPHVIFPRANARKHRDRTKCPGFYRPDLAKCPSIYPR